MAVGTPTAATAAAASVAFPAHAIGDVLIVITDKAAVAPAITTPVAGGTVPTWISIQVISADSDVLQAFYAIATATNHTTGTWTNATNITVVVVTGTLGTLGMGASAQATQSVTGTLIRYPALTRNVTDGTSAILRVGHRRVAAAAVGNVPTANYTNLKNAPATPVTSVFYYLAAAANPTQDDVTGFTTSATKAITLEITFASTARIPRNPAVNFQNPGWMMKAFRPGWRPRRSGLLVPGLALPQPA